MFMQKQLENIRIRSLKVGRIGKDLLERIVDLNQACFPVCSREECRADITVHSDLIRIAENKTSGEIVGLWGERSYPLDDPPNVYIPIGAVADSERGKRIFQRLAYDSIMNALANGFTVLKFSTQNGKVEYGIRKALDRIVEEEWLNNYVVTRELGRRRMSYRDQFETLEHGYRPAGTADLTSNSEQLNREYSVLNAKEGDMFEITVEMRTTVSLAQEKRD